MRRLGTRRSVESPEGRQWTVGVRWLPRRPHWIGWGPGRRRAAEPAADPTPDAAADPRRKNRWFDALDVSSHGLDALDDIPGLLVVGAIAVAIALVWFFLVPLAVLALDVVLVVLLAVASAVARMLLRRPWIVEARATDEVHHWPVEGLRASRRHVDAVADALSRGETPT